MSVLTENEIMIGNTINELHRLFHFFNEKLFQAKLEAPVIIVQSNKRRTLGTFSVNRIWKRKGTDVTPERFEITLSAEHLNRPIEEICATLIHEMVHLYCELNKIKDTSNNNVYHNKNFKKAAEEHGLVITHAKTIGWSVTTLQDSTKQLIRASEVKNELFDYYRKGAKVFEPIAVCLLTPKEKLQRLYERQQKMEIRLAKLKGQIVSLENKIEE